MHSFGDHEASNTAAVEVATSSGRLGGLRAGNPENSALLLVHGWPLTSAIWEPALSSLSENFYVLAFDLPGIGLSGSVVHLPVSLPEIASTLLDGAESAGARDVMVVGVDVGGMIAFSAVRHFPERVRSAVIMNTVIPGVAPWDEVISNPQIWHFAFHQTPALPELLVAGHQRSYFDFFLDMLSGNKAAITNEIRQRFADAYAKPTALKTGFDWYRMMGEAAKQNADGGPIETPLLYLRGDADRRDIAPYIEGLRQAGAQYVSGEVIAGCGEIISLEKPERLVAALLKFARAG